MINALAVFCGSQSGNEAGFEQAAKDLGSLLAKQRVRVIYGGGKAGLMGIVADACLCHGGHITGVIPQLLKKAERAHTGLSQLIFTEDMHERKKKMYELCDAALILPGGYGTLDELFEMITWNNLSIHDKRIFILNVNGFYDHLLQHINKMFSSGFLYNDPAQNLIVLNSVTSLQPFLLT